MESVEEAVQEYLDEGSDPEGELLCSEIKELIAASMTEDELNQLIEKNWRAQSNARFGYRYKKVLGQIIQYLDRQNRQDFPRLRPEIERELAGAVADYKKGKNVSKTFSNSDEIARHLRSSWM